MEKKELEGKRFLQMLKKKKKTYLHTEIHIYSSAENKGRDIDPG